MANVANNNETMTLVINASLLENVQKINKASFASIEYDGEEKLPKYLGLGKVTKHAIGNVQMRYDYGNAVNNRLEKEGLERTFEPQPLRWGKWFMPNLLIVNDTDSYLRYYLVKGSEIHTQYFVDGREATAEEDAIIRAYKAGKNKGSKTQSDAGLEGNQVIPCTINTKNVLSLKCGECHYKREEHARVIEVTR